MVQRFPMCTPPTTTTPTASPIINIPTRVVLFLLQLMNLYRRATITRGPQCTSRFTLGLLVVHYSLKFIFRERGREGEREGEKHQCARETFIGVAGP